MRGRLRNARRLVLLLPALAAVAFGITGCTKRGMTWNVNGVCAIYHPPVTDCNPPYHTRAEAMRDWPYVLQTQKPDVVSIQEVCNGPGRWDIQETTDRTYSGGGLAYYYSFANTHPDPPALYHDCGNALLTDVPQEDVKCWYVSFKPARSCTGFATGQFQRAGTKAPEPPSSCPEVDCRLVVAATVNFSDGTNTFPVRIYNTHITNAGSVAGGNGHDDQIKALASIVQSDAPGMQRKVIMGDFQTTSSASSVFDPVKGAVPGGFRSVETDPSHPFTSASAKHDYIWVTCKVDWSGLSTWAVGTAASDHYPMWADFSDRSC